MRQEWTRRICWQWFAKYGRAGSQARWAGTDRRRGLGLDVRIGGGPSTIRQFLAADLIDHMDIAIVPIVLARGERLWDGFHELEKRFNVEAVSSPSGVTHLALTADRSHRIGLAAGVRGQVPQGVLSRYPYCQA